MALNNLDAFVKVCRKLDELRFKGNINWGNSRRNIFKNQKLKPSTRIFLFWLCSIIDQFYPYVKIWTDGEKAMLNILKNKPKTFSDVKKTDAKRKNRQQRKHDCRNTHRRKNLQTRTRRLSTTQKYVQLPLNLQPKQQHRRPLHKTPRKTNQKPTRKKQHIKNGILPKQLSLGKQTNPRTITKRIRKL